MQVLSYLAHDIQYFSSNIMNNRLQVHIQVKHAHNSQTNQIYSANYIFTSLALCHWYVRFPSNELSTHSKQIHTVDIRLFWHETVTDIFLVKQRSGLAAFYSTLNHMTVPIITCSIITVISI